MECAADNYIEIEYPVESGVKLDRIWDVKSIIDRALRASVKHKGWVQAWRGKGLNGSTVWIRCFANGSGGQWDVIKRILEERGVLKEATVYQNHPALKYRTQIWP